MTAPHESRGKWRANGGGAAINLKPNTYLYSATTRATRELYDFIQLYRELFMSRSLCLAEGMHALLNEKHS